MIVTIRNQATSDIDAIEAVTIAAFRDVSHTNHTERFIVRALRSAGQLFVSLVADYNHDVVGHAAVSPVTISGGCGGWSGLGPISVLPRHQGQGFGTQLVRRALAELRESGAAGCVVLGEPAFYSRFGFNPSPGSPSPASRRSIFRLFPFSERSLRGS